MNRIDDPVNDTEALRRELKRLDGDLEQALVALEDAREEAHRLAEERNRLLDSLAARDRAIAAMSRQLADATAVRRPAGGTDPSDDGETGDDLLAEELQNTVEELRVLAEELEEANAELEHRVDERTAALSVANAALRATDERLRLAQRCAGAGTWEWHVDTGAVSWSPECLELLGLDDDPTMTAAERWLAVLHPDDRGVTDAAAAAAQAGETDELRMEFRVRHPTAGLRWIAAIGRVVERIDGRPRRILGLSIDITATKDLEERLRAAKEEAERADAAKSRFLAAASHDLRQPIQAAALYTEVLRRHVDGTPAQEVLDLLSASIEGLNRMLGGLLDLSRLEAGVIQPDIVDFVPDTLMTRLASEFQAEAEVSGIALRCVPGTDAVATDPHLLERVLRNLVSNALKHGACDEGGRVTLSCRRTGDRVEFEVWDNGPGIAPDDRERIFEEFQQLNNPERNAARGFGLGLAIVARIARLLDATVEVRSELGRGSVFSVAVPASDGAAAQPIAHDAVSAEAMAGLSGRTALLVEDDQAVRHAVTLLLRHWGLGVIAAADAAKLDAALAAQASAPDVLIADYRLPAGATAGTVIESVRRRWPVPAIIITGDTAPERLREAASLDCRLLHKPVQAGELAWALHDALAGALAGAAPAPRQR